MRESELMQKDGRFLQQVRQIEGARVSYIGISMPIVHKLVELHGGSVNVESTLGRGSRFVVRLPALDAAH